MKKYIAAVIIACLVIGCVCIWKLTRHQTEERQNENAVVLTVWASEDSQDILRQMVEAFEKEYEGEAELDIRMGVEEEKAIWENIHDTPQAAADVFAFADDQLDNMIRDEILLPVTLHTDEIIEAAGGMDATAVESAMRDGVLYAYPLTASNGYYLYYNSEYLTEEDVKSLDRILEVAQANDKYFAMDWTSGWYLYSFFKGAGMQVVVNDDSITNTCNWNRTDGQYKGTDVVKSLLDIAASPAFFNAPDAILKNGFQDGKVIAGVSGAWNAEFMEKCLGDNCAAAKLPTYTVNGEQVQMGSFEGFKLVGVNSHTREAEWAMRLAEWITNYDNQILRYKEIGEKPANTAVFEKGDIEVTKAVRALQEQSQFSSIQRIGSNYWDAATLFGTVIASENADETQLQTLLDELVETLAKDGAEE